jgi:hypothetical protein
MALKLYEIERPTPTEISVLTIKVLSAGGRLSRLQEQLAASRDKSA